MKKLLAAILLMALFTSCGSEKNKEEKAEEAYFSQYKNGSCGVDVVSDYNISISPCRSMYSREDIEKCESKLLQFKSKYPGINCTAKKADSINESFTISESYINELIQAVQNL